MKNTLFITLFFVPVFFLSCTRTKDGTINDINIVNINLSKSFKGDTKNFFSTVYLLPLETTKNGVLGSSLILRCNMDNIFVSDKTKVICFIIDDNGGKIKYIINKLGKGPQEYSEIIDFAVNNKYLVVYTDGGVVIYNVENGKFLKKIKINIAAREINLFNDYIIFYTSFFQNPVKYHYELLTFNINNNEIKKYFKHIDKDLGSYLERQIFNYNGNVYYCSPFRNVIYKFNNNAEPKPFALLSFGDNSQDIIDLKKIKSIENKRSLESSKYFYYFGNLFITDKYFSLTYCHKGSFYRIWYDSEQPDKSAVVGGSAYQEILYKNRLVSLMNSYDISQFDPEKYKDNKEALKMYSKVLNVTEDDNPCLRIIELK